jgi:cystathionine gamma-synthase
MTKALHAEGHQKPMNAHTMPIFQTSTFYFDSVEHGADLFAGRRVGHIYTRIGNPTVEAFERVIAALEGGQEAVAFSSGMAAIYASLVSMVGQGDHIISGDTLYGPTIHLIADVIGRGGVASTFVDSSNAGAVEAAFRPNTRVVFLETPANPTCRITDVEQISRLAHARGALAVVDATFGTPRFIRPLELGADVSLHSTTKFINGHGDVVGGIVSTRAELAKVIRKFRTDTGACPAPIDAFLSLRGVRTLGLRMERHNANALVVAEYLSRQPKVSRVYFHGLPADPGHAVAVRQMSGFGSTFAFDMAGGYDAAKRLLQGVKVMSLAVSLGTADTLIQHPASMTHASVPPEIMRQQGLTPEMVRIHVGLEDAQDLIADLDQAFARV